MSVCHARIRAASNDAGETSVRGERKRFDPGRGINNRRGMKSWVVGELTEPDHLLSALATAADPFPFAKQPRGRQVGRRRKFDDAVPILTAPALESRR